MISIEYDNAIMYFAQKHDEIFNTKCSWSIDDTQTFTLAAAAGERFWTGTRDAGAPHCRVSVQIISNKLTLKSQATPTR